MAFSITYYDNIRYHRMDFINRDLDFFGNGVVATSDFPLTFPSTPNMTCTLGQGRAWVDGYRIFNDSNPITINFLAADPTNPRIDIIQLGHDDINSTYSLQVKKGVAAASPVEPNADPGFVKLYAINVAANATSISASNIIDRRGLVPLNVSTTQINLGGSAGTNQNNTFNAGYTQTFNGPVVANSTLATKNSTLDDGNGNAIFGGGISVNGGGVKSSASSFEFVPATGGTVGFTNAAQTGWGLRVIDGTTPATFTNKNTLDDGAGNMLVHGSTSFFGTSALQPTSGATSTANYGSAALSFGSSTWNGTASVSNWRDILMDSSNNLIFTNTGGSGVATLDNNGKLVLSGGLVTEKNILDDGGGNTTLAGGLNAESMGEHWLGGFRFANDLNYNYIESYSANKGTASLPLKITGKSGTAVSVQTFSNTLDDGQGNVLFNGNITLSNTGQFNILQGSGSYFHIRPSANGQVGFTNNSGGAWGLVVSDGSAPSVKSFKNTLDDGSGNATFAGSGSFDGPIVAGTDVQLQPSGTATSTAEHYSNPLYFYGSHWNGSAAVSNILTVQGDNLGGFYASSNGSGANKTIFEVDNLGDGTFAGNLTIQNDNVLVQGYSKTAGTSQYQGNWAGGNHWGIGPNTSAGDNTLRIGMTDSAQGWYGASNAFTLYVAGQLKSLNNTLDDGSGNTTTQGIASFQVKGGSSGELRIYGGEPSGEGYGNAIYFSTDTGSDQKTTRLRSYYPSGIAFEASPTHQPYGTDPTGLTDYAKILGMDFTSFAVTTKNNTLDDGSGNATFSSQVQVNMSSNLPALTLQGASAGWGSGFQLNNTTTSTGKSYGIYSGSDGQLHFTDVTSGADRLIIDGGGNSTFTNGSLKSAKNTLDDGSGKSTFSGLATFNNNVDVSASGTATSTNDYWSSALNFYGSHWNGTAAVSNYSWIQGDPNGGFNVFNSVIGASSPLLTVNETVIHYKGNSLPDITQFASSLSGNGYQKLPNGLIIQWGRVANVPNATMTSYALPIAFPNYLLQATVGILNADGRTSWNPVSNSQIGLYQDSGAAQPMSYIAIGY